jgi:hypothetical protein
MYTNNRYFSERPLIFMGMGFIFNSFLLFCLVYIGCIDWGALFFVYTMIFLLYQLMTSIPISKAKKEVILGLENKYVGNAKIDIERLVEYGFPELAEKYAKCVAIGSFNVGAYFSWVILVLYFIATRSVK